MAPTLGIQNSDQSLPGTLIWSQNTSCLKSEIEAQREILGDWFARQSDLEWVEPQAGVACFPRITRPEAFDVEKFYKILNETYGTYVGPGHWLEIPRYFFRIGFGWPSREELTEGLNNISLALQDARI
jgi:aspartate/methionine/tyrosine aminotransferase